MTIYFPAINDALIVLSLFAGIAVALSIAIVAGAAVVQRGKTRTARAFRATAGVAQAADPRRLVLR